MYESEKKSKQYQITHMPLSSEVKINHTVCLDVCLTELPCMNKYILSFPLTSIWINPSTACMSKITKQIDKSFRKPTLCNQRHLYTTYRISYIDWYWYFFVINKGRKLLGFRWKWCWEKIHSFVFHIQQHSLCCLYCDLCLTWRC